MQAGKKKMWLSNAACTMHAALNNRGVTLVEIAKRKESVSV